MRYLKAFYWRLFIIRLASRWITKPNLGDLVKYKGQVWRLRQGVNTPIWTLGQGDMQEVRVHETDFRKVRTPANYWGSFRHGYRFYMRNWYRIWMNEGIKDWMHDCNIWGK